MRKSTEESAKAHSMYALVCSFSFPKNCISSTLLNRIKLKRWRSFIHVTACRSLNFERKQLVRKLSWKSFQPENPKIPEFPKCKAFKRKFLKFRKENQMEWKLKFPTFPRALPETWIMLCHSSLETKWQIEIRIFH